jgi:hypothetical protein
MLELGTFGSVRGVPGDGYPYRNPRSEAALRQAPRLGNALESRPPAHGGRVKGAAGPGESRPSRRSWQRQPYRLRFLARLTAPTAATS